MERAVLMAVAEQGIKQECERLKSQDPSYDCEKDTPTEATGTFAQFWTVQAVLMADLMRELFWDNMPTVIAPYPPFETLFNIFNFTISPITGIHAMSSCLRDDIWELELLKEKVVNEMLKAYWLWNAEVGDRLFTDYQFLRDHIYLLRHYGGTDRHIPEEKIKGFLEKWNELEKCNTKKDNTKCPSATYYFFGSEEARNYYKFWQSDDKDGCPTDDFVPAIEKIERSADKMQAIAKAGDGDTTWSMDSIRKEAERRAAKRIREWVAANKITLTIAGQNGGNMTSLVKAFTGSTSRFMGQWNTEVAIIKNMFKPADIFFDYMNTDDDYDLKKEEFTKTEKDALEKKQAETKDTEDKIKYAEKELQYQITFGDVSNNGLLAIEAQMKKLEEEIKRGVEWDGTKSGELTPSLCENLREISKNHCTNKQSKPLSCQN